VITDPRHAEQLRQAGHTAWNQLITAWTREHHDANAPTSGPAVTVGGGQPSDPVSQIATNPDRERHARWIAARITGLLDQLQKEVERLTPKAPADVGMCVNCDTMPGVEQGRCPECGPFFRKHGYDRNPEDVAEKWHAQLDTRPCRMCGEPIKMSEKKRTCDACRARKSRANRQDSAA
jgi:hypothetical protein